MPAQPTLGQLITRLYDAYVEVCDDEDLASVATASSVNRMLADDRVRLGDPDDDGTRAALALAA